MTLPNFLIVGAAKSGTTSLYYYLAQHPDVFMSKDKEPHHFAPAKWCGRPPLNREEYEQLFAESDAYPARGEASTGYLYYQESPDWIHQTIPDCRIVILLRDPVARAFSGYCHELREGLETVSFEEALAEEGRGLRIVRGGDFSFNYIKQGFVSSLVERYLELFSPERVHICLYEDLLSEPDRVMRSLFEFLGVDATFKGDWSYQYNPSGVPRYRWLHSLVDGEGPVSLGLAAIARKMLPPSIRTPIWHKLRDWNVKLGPVQQINSETEATLRSTFEPEVKNLEKLLGVRLPNWL